jgi:nucleotidyltransferase/DNA polymerase involved in DNA repair
MAMVLGYNQFGLDVMAAPARHGVDYSNITVLALQLYTDYIYSIQHLNNKQEQYHDCADINQNQSNC